MIIQQEMQKYIYHTRQKVSDFDHFFPSRFPPNYTQMMKLADDDNTKYENVHLSYQRESVVAFAIIHDM